VSNVNGASGVSPNRADSIQLLGSQLEDITFRRSMIELLNISSLMRGCVIDKTYTVPDTLVAPLHLTVLGREVFDAVHADRPRLKPNDIKFALLLVFGCPAGLFVEPTSDLDAMRRGLSVELKKQKILFPYIFGRDLHDAAAEAYPEKYELGLEETIKLLKGLPPGVFQEGYTTTGPFGCVEADVPRYLYSDVNVPGYYCSDATCSDIHGLALKTADGPTKIASVNKTARYVGDYLRRQYGSVEDGHARLVRDASQIEMNAFTIDSPEAIIEVIADSLDDGELRAVAEDALRAGLKQHGAKSLSVRLSSVINNPGQFVQGLSRPHILQLLLMFSTEIIVAAVDNSVRAGTIEICEHEVRTRKLSRFGNSSISAEIGTRGIRLSGGGSFVASRLLELLHHLYYASQTLTSRDLAYLIGGSQQDGQDGAEGTLLLDNAVRQLSPEDILRKLVLGSWQANDSARSFLGIPPVQPEDREELLQTFLWKLGASSTILFRDFARVELHEGELRAGIEIEATHAVIRGHISNLFASIEGGLRTSLEFSTWVMTNDHFMDEDSFVYDSTPVPSRLRFIEEFAPTSDDKLKLDLGGKNSLFALGAGFARLAGALQSLRPDEFCRPADQIPLICRESDHPFAFPHIIPFLDLSEKARVLAIETLHSISRIVQDENVLKVRNASLHGAHDFPTRAEMIFALEKIESLRKTLSSSGLYPSVFRLTGSTRDVLGRSKFQYEGTDAEVVLYSPSWAVSPKIPTGARQLVVVPLCDTVSSGPLRFRLKSRPGKDPYWEGWPKRWEVTEHYSVSTHAAAPEVKERSVG